MKNKDKYLIWEAYLNSPQGNPEVEHVNGIDVRLYKDRSYGWSLYFPQVELTDNIPDNVIPLPIGPGQTPEDWLNAAVEEAKATSGGGPAERPITDPVDLYIEMEYMARIIGTGDRREQRIQR